MNKAILVIDMPACCRECPLCGEDHMTYRDYCRVTNNHIWTLDKPDWCPLKPAPKKQNNIDWPAGFVEVTQEEFDNMEKNPDIIYIIKEEKSNEYSKGYNACINEILGE